MPAAVAAIAKMPYGVSVTTNRVARETACPATASTSSSTCLRSTPISAIPRITENRTTAGTMLLASELNGFDGM